MKISSIEDLKNNPELGVMHITDLLSKPKELLEVILENKIVCFTTYDKELADMLYKGIISEKTFCSSTIGVIDSVNFEFKVYSEKANFFDLSKRSFALIITSIL